MKKKFLVALLVGVMALTACGQEKMPEALESAPVKESIETAEKAEEVVEEQKTLIDTTGKLRSKLTGEWIDEEIAKRRSIAVMMPNNKKALPQYGISQASIIYEAPVEGRITRLMAVYEDYDSLDRIGPVRSSRDYYIYEAMALDSIYVNWGLAVPYVKDLINSDRIDNISQAVEGISNPAPEVFDRVSRGSSYATEYTGYMFIDKLEKAIDKKGYETEYRDTFVKSYEFAEDGKIEEYTSEADATMIYPGGKEKNKGGYGDALPYFEYNKEDHKYYRYEYDGPQIDEMNEEQLAVTNVIFKLCHGEVRDDHDYLAFRVHGEGDCIVFTNGKVIEGTWARKSDNEPNLLYDKNGNEIVLNQGKTWICNIWEEYADNLCYE